MIRLQNFLKRMVYTNTQYIISIDTTVRVKTDMHRAQPDGCFYG